jgi:hypothetical protein
MQIKTNNNEAIGDMCPVKLFPNLSIFLTKILSISSVKLNKKPRKIILYKNAIIIIKNVTKDFVNRDFSKLIFIKKRIHKAIKVIDTIGEMGLYFKENEAKAILSKSQPHKLTPVIISTRKRSDSFLLMI